MHTETLKVVVGVGIVIFVAFLVILNGGHSSGEYIPKSSIDQTLREFPGWDIRIETDFRLACSVRGTVTLLSVT